MSRLSYLKPKERQEVENKDELVYLAREVAAREGRNRTLIKLAQGKKEHHSLWIMKCSVSA